MNVPEPIQNPNPVYGDPDAPPQEVFQPLVEDYQQPVATNNDSTTSDKLGITVGILSILICLWCVVDFAYLIAQMWNLSVISHNPLILFSIVSIFIVMGLFLYAIIGAISGLHRAFGVAEKYEYALNFTVGLIITTILMNVLKLIYGFFVSATIGFPVAIITVFVGVVINLVCCTGCIAVGAFYARSLHSQLPVDDTEPVVGFGPKLKDKCANMSKFQKMFVAIGIVLIVIVVIGILGSSLVSIIIYSNPNNISMVSFRRPNCIDQSSTVNFKPEICYQADARSLKFAIENGEIHLKQYLDGDCEQIWSSTKVDKGQCYNNGSGGSFRMTLF